MLVLSLSDLIGRLEKFLEEHPNLEFEPRRFHWRGTRANGRLEALWLSVAGGYCPLDVGFTCRDREPLTKLARGRGCNGCRHLEVAAYGSVPACSRAPGRLESWREFASELENVGAGDDDER